MRKSAFTIIELLFVIIIIGILSKFGFEFLRQAYENFIFSNINQQLQANSEMAVESIASRLQYRIKDSVIARNPGVAFAGLANSTLGANGTVLEWVGYDIDSLRAGATPSYSGIVDLNHASTTATQLLSPETNTTAINATIAALSNGGSGMANTAIYFLGSNSDATTGYGWNGVAITTQGAAMHPVKADGANAAYLVPRRGDNGVTNGMAGFDGYEYYQLAWSAYAVALEGSDLFLYYNYQPWEGEAYTVATIANGNKVLLMQNVDTFRFTAVGSIVKLQVCVRSTQTNNTYSICKEKTVF